MDKINVYNTIMIKIRKKRKYMEIKEIFLHKSASKILFTNGIHSLLTRPDTRGSADIIYV